MYKRINNNLLCGRYKSEQQDNRIENWSSGNNMLLHEKKFELLCHTDSKLKLITELPYSQ